MGDIDSEYTRKRRNKFQDERSEVTKYYRTEKFVPSREESSNRSRSRVSTSRVRDRSDSFSPEEAAKRPRYNNYQRNEYNNRRYQTYQKPRLNVRPNGLLPMPFKNFILTQDDRISETDAIANYVKYKLTFQIEQIESFFKAHQNEEWFRIKYHPQDSKKHKEEQVNALKRRCDVFLELFNSNKIDCVNLDSDKTNDLLKIMDMVVLKLEGGTEEDIAALEQEYLQLENKVKNLEPEDVESVNDKKETTEKMEIDECLGKSEIVQENSPVEQEELKIEKHKTSSICLRNLSSTITRKEIESICSKYDGFIRVSLSDPQPENNWIRQGWVTFKRDSNVKEICDSINKLRVKDSELNAVVSEDLTNRICLVNGITADKEVVKSDIRMSAKVVLHLDKQAGLWLEDKQSTEQPKNPVLRIAKDYLVEEEILEEPDETTLNRDDNLIAILDKIILYLRIVHSVDYYNHCQYPNEDEMPNRCGILHVRGPPPASKTKISQFLSKEMEAKLAQFLPGTLNKSESELVALGLKDFDTEVDKFVLENTKKLSQDKWQCPLCMKKFKSPDFVRKHIFLKHFEKIDEVKASAEFFNNYLRDPKRMAWVPAQVEKKESDVPPRYQIFTTNDNPEPAQVMDVRNSSREIIRYEDLDAPVEIEEMF